MSPTIRIQVDDNDAQKMFASLVAMAGDLSVPIRDATAVFEQRIRQTFRDEASPWGEPWAPHSAVTTKGRARRGNTRTSLLIDTGQMYGSLRSESGTDEATISIGGPGIFAAVHQFGNPLNKAWGHGLAPIPARPFFPVRADDSADLPPTWIDEGMAPFAVALRGATA